jgi:hypothetical protein
MNAPAGRYIPAGAASEENQIDAELRARQTRV